MKQLAIFLFFLLLPLLAESQEIKGRELLEKSIQFHDPEGRWETFQGTLYLTMETPSNLNRDSKITIDLPNQYFKLVSRRGSNTIEYSMDKERCRISFNGESDLSDEVKNKNNLSCDRARLFKNYYTYLYGLPMKLKDRGTRIQENVAKIEFKGEKYLVLKVDYEKEVGNDTWFFYFNPETYALEIYQFLKHGEPNTGEYILLSGLETVNGIKIPKTRAWYYNKDDQYLATDVLKSGTQID